MSQLIHQEQTLLWSACRNGLIGSVEWACQQMRKTALPMRTAKLISKLASKKQDYINAALYNIKTQLYPMEMSDDVETAEKMREDMTAIIMRYFPNSVAEDLPW